MRGKLKTLRILVLSDLHYSKDAAEPNGEDERHRALGPVLLRKCLNRAKSLDPGINLVILLGDLVEDGSAPGAEADLAELATILKHAGIPWLAVPGNHDRDPGRFATIMSTRPGLHEIGGYGFLVFHDRVGAGDVTSRPDDALSLPVRSAAEKPGLPLVALQHNPLHPDIEADYPYMLENADDVIASYENGPVILSLSGHYHAGQPLHTHRHTRYFTAGALAESPFPYTVLTLERPTSESTPVRHSVRVNIKDAGLRLEMPGLSDCHCHTEFAYCASTVTAKGALSLAGDMGLETQCFSEHAFQLYFEPEVAWKWKWQTDRTLREAVWTTGRGRMPQFRAFASKLRRDGALVGIEVDLLSDGGILLAPEDEDAWDFLVGAVHTIPGLATTHTTQAGAEALFLEQTESLVSHRIDILAHPFRFFRRSDLRKPVHLYEHVAGLLAQHGVAAEINFHTNSPDPVFFKKCLEHGVKLTLGTDSHAIESVGELSPHVQLLHEVGIECDGFDDVMWNPVQHSRSRTREKKREKEAVL